MDSRALIQHSWRPFGARLLAVCLGCALSICLFAAVAPAYAGQSLFWLQTDGTASHLGTVTNPQVNAALGESVPLYLWLNKDSLTYGFDGISLDVRLISSDGGQATATISFDEPAGRWYGTSGGTTRTDSGGVGVEDCNAIDLSNTDTLASNPLRLATINITANTAGTVQVFLCIGAMGISDGGNNAVVWLGLADGSTTADQQLINGGIPGLCSTVPEATISIIGTYDVDFDNDGDVDMEDFAHLQNCLAGPLTPQTDPACADTLLNNDVYVDEADVDIFAQCLSGPNNTAAANCR